MSFYLGIDTSNYTTSLAIYNDEDKTMIQSKKPLPVKEGEKGIRQSDAVFHHTVQLTQLIDDLFKDFNGDISAVGVSSKPSNQDGSYMPCFLPGLLAAKAISSSKKIPLCSFSHQDGHIAAVIYASKAFDLINKEFIAFHISGGTTQVLKVKPCGKYFSTEIIASSLDLKAGQAIDRTGLMLGLNFPCGPELEKLAVKSNTNFNNIHVFRKDGSFSLSGVENKCKKMIEDNEKKEDIALYCIKYIEKVILDTCLDLEKTYGEIPMLFSGGVMSNSIIQKDISGRFNAFFAEPSFSSDNAAGLAFLTSLLSGEKL